jgi:hypothetical protein
MADELGFSSQEGQQIILFSAARTPALGPIQWVLELFFWGKSIWVVKLTTNHHLVHRLRMHGARHPCLHMSLWCVA